MFIFLYSSVAESMFGPGLGGKGAGAVWGGGGRTMNNWDWLRVRTCACVWSIVNNGAAAPFFLNERGRMSLSSAPWTPQMRPVVMSERGGARERPGRAGDGTGDTSVKYSMPAD